MSDTIYASDIECRCDCVNCVTGNHDGCYYDSEYGEPECPLHGLWQILNLMENEE